MGLFDIHCVAKYRNKRRGDPLVESRKVLKNSPSAEKPKEKTKEGVVLCFRGSGRRCDVFVLDEVLAFRVCFGRP